MLCLSGEYECKLDAKGRIVLPARIKARLPEETGNLLMLVRGFEPCLVAYPQQEWLAVYSKVNALNEFNEAYRNFQRNFFRGSNEADIDNQGRFMIPKTMLAYAQLESTVIVAGLGNRIELWNPKLYEQYLVQDAGVFSKQAEQFLASNSPANS